MKDGVGRRCPSSSISNYMLSRAISEEFPSAKSMKLGKQRHMYVVGVDKLEKAGASSTAADSDDSSECLRLALKERDELQCQNAVLQQRIEDLQQQNVDLQKGLDEFG